MKGDCTKCRYLYDISGACIVFEGKGPHTTMSCTKHDKPIYRKLAYYHRQMCNDYKPWTKAERERRKDTMTTACSIKMDMSWLK